MQLQNPFVDIPQLSRTLAVVVASVSLLSILLVDLTPYLALKPGLYVSPFPYSLPWVIACISSIAPHFYIWNIFTAGYLETSLLNVTLLHSLFTFSLESVLLWLTLMLHCLIT